MQVISVNHQFASSLRRLAAFCIDRLIVSIIISIFFNLVFDWGWRLDGGIFSMSTYHSPWAWLNIYDVFREAIFLIYYPIMESSKYQGTIGKIVMGIRVTGLDNERISLAKAILRSLSKILSAAILGIGYIMIMFDDRKQGLHDKIADTLVVKQ